MNPTRLIRLPQVIFRTGLSRSSIYSAVQRGDFPRQVSLGPRAVGWIEQEVHDWLNLKIEQSRNGGQQ